MGFPARFNAPDPQKEKFFREHFFHTLLVRFNGGDARRHYNMNQATDIRSHLDDHGSRINIEDEVWKGPLGKDTLKLLHDEDTSEDDD